jgi:hypothetical protein
MSFTRRSRPGGSCVGWGHHGAAILKPLGWSPSRPPLAPSRPLAGRHDRREPLSRPCGACSYVFAPRRHRGAPAGRRSERACRLPAIAPSAAARTYVQGSSTMVSLCLHVFSQYLQSPTDIRLYIPPPPLVPAPLLPCPRRLAPPRLCHHDPGRSRGRASNPSVPRGTVVRLHLGGVWMVTA